MGARSTFLAWNIAIWVGAVNCLAKSPSEPPSIDTQRKYLDRLHSKERAQLDKFELPFLITQTAFKIPMPPERVSSLLRNRLKIKALPFRAHYGDDGGGPETLSPAALPLPKHMLTKREIEGIHKCDSESCKMKVLLPVEGKAMEKVPKKDEARVAAYHQLILDRVSNFLKTRFLRGYEDRNDNHSYIGKGLEKLEYFEKQYPKCFKFLKEEFWTSAKTECEIKDNYLRMELAVLKKADLREILRIGDVFEFAEAGRTILFEFHIYTSHYFDSSIRIFEVLSMPGSEQKSILIMTDVMEVDQLKRSGLVRALYRRQIQDAVRDFQDRESKAFE